MLNESDTLQLSCTASPPARLTWLKRSNAGDADSVETQFAIARRSITYFEEGSFSQSTLVIRNVVGSDSANYICVAENSNVSSLPTSVNYTVDVNGKN